MRLQIRGEYPPDWTQIAARVKAEAGHRCIRCLHPAETPTQRMPCDELCKHGWDGKQRILTVHHLDGDKSNCRWWNLLALCQKCHLKIQAKVIPGRSWLFRHTDWFQPYAAGYYAYVLGMEVSREQVEARLEAFLQMGQPWLYGEVEGIE